MQWDRVASDRQYETYENADSEDAEDDGPSKSLTKRPRQSPLTNSVAVLQQVYSTTPHRVKPNTSRCYATAWKHFEAWCVQQKLDTALEHLVDNATRYMLHLCAADTRLKELKRLPSRAAQEQAEMLQLEKEPHIKQSAFKQFHAGLQQQYQNANAKVGFTSSVDITQCAAYSRAYTTAWRQIANHDKQSYQAERRRPAEKLRRAMSLWESFTRAVYKETVLVWALGLYGTSLVSAVVLPNFVDKHKVKRPSAPPSLKEVCWQQSWPVSRRSSTTDGVDMRFKATFTPKGLRILEKAFLPTLEKGGKACHVLLGEEEVNFVQTPFNTDGACVTARFQVDVLFYQDSYVLASKHHNLVAFVVEIGLLLRVLHAVEANEAESLDVKLTQKPVAVPGSTQEVSRPFLSFVGRGSSKSLMLDLPISKPLAPAEVDRLVAVKEVAALSPFYVDLAPCCLMLHALVDKMRSGNDTLMLATCKAGSRQGSGRGSRRGSGQGSGRGSRRGSGQGSGRGSRRGSGQGSGRGSRRGGGQGSVNGDVLLTVSAVNVALGSHVRQLDVYPQSVAPAAECDRSLPVEQQLHAALQAGDAVAVSLPLKHLARVLNVSLLSAPAQILCGVGEGAAHVHIMFVYRDPSKDHAYDETVALSFRLPVKDEH
ncbi:hypothetical protein QJQ45_026865 [Haematococcus lacustris]|nr:hypothetical protein QJQ45_026865 [Haematococcus lacustris]